MSTIRALVAAPRTESGVEMREVDVPTGRPYEALVAVEAVALNRGEVRALASAADGWRPGWDVAGRVAEPAADGNGPRAGTRVVGLVAGGGWAELVPVNTRVLAPIPDELSFAAASTLPVAGLTAQRALAMGELTDSKRVLVTGAAGGVGWFAVQLAAHAGADVTAVVGREERGKGLAEVGASQVSVGMPATGEYDLILESAGGESLAAALALVAPGGAVVSYGNSSRQSTTFDPSSFYSKHAARLCGFQLFPELQRTASGTSDLAALALLAAEGRLDVHVGLEASWRDPAPALRALMERQVQGKAVLNLD